MQKAIVIGAGIGGLATAVRLQLKGYQCSVFEANSYPGGKLSEFDQGAYRFDAGPSLFTLPMEVDALFQAAGKDPRDYFNYQRLEVITNYFFPDGTRIHAYSDPEAFAEEVHSKTGESKLEIKKLLEKSEELYDITHKVFLESSLHKMQTYLRMDTLKSIMQLHKIDAFRSMNQANAARFNDPRVVQLFNRYATYNGSDPYQAPATLNIIPHLEFNMGAYFPQGGMYHITESIYKLGKELGVQYHFDQKVDEILIENKKVKGISIDGNEYKADLIVSNADIVPTYRRLLKKLPAPESTLEQPRSSSALIFYWGINQSFPEMDVHNIFFTEDYKEEFDYIWKKKEVYDDPTIYVNISSKLNPNDAPEGAENWFTMINVPHDDGQNWDEIIERSRKNILAKLKKMLGKDVESHIEVEAILEPRTIQSKTSSHLGALYGNSSNNPFAAFLRHPNFSRQIEGLFFCGGSVHPGGGIPLCLLSARIVGDLVPSPKVLA
ncbi:MAG: phytoene desaturase family protein [Bacteroidia bacterium]|nr:phytoene desaturase family protein [Bacteroidia bacterium]